MSSGSPLLKLRLTLLSLGVLVLDQWTKQLVESRLAGEAPLVLIPGLLDLVYVSNTGVAFGLFAAHGDMGWRIGLTVLGLLALALVAYYFWRTPDDRRLTLVALALILGGAIGNVLDRIVSGMVTDFVDVYLGSHHFPTFNTADSAITIGILLMAVDVHWSQREMSSS